MSRTLAAACVGLTLISLTAPAAGGARCVLDLDRPEDLLLGPSLELKNAPVFLAKAPTPTDRADRPLDVLHYDLALDVSLESEALSGTVALRAVMLAPADTLILDLLSQSGSNGVGVTATGPVRVGGVDRPYEHVADQLRISLAETAAAGDTLEAEVGFAGTPVRDFILGYRLRNFFDRDDPELPVLEDEPVLMTLSEPDAARSWWPCHDHPFDAATVDLSVTAPARFTLAAPGLQVADESLPGGMRRQEWSMTSPIPTYLVSINLADYVTWEENVTLDHLVDAATGQVETRTVPIQYYVPSFEEANARYTWANTPAMIEEFAEAFGPYPFADLKYGMSLFQFGGAMEHPTISSMGQFTISSVENEFGAPAGEWVSAHELAHQWFGDAVRVERWGEIWLNEGFAQWAEVLWFERFYGEEAGRLWLDALWREEFPGTLVDPGAFFGNTVYKKGARVVHQLRQVMGDQDFFAALRNYVNDPELRFARAASSADLQAHCEALYGESLDWFFEPWLNWEGRPFLRVLRYRIDDGMRLVVRQPSDRVYRLPLPVRLQLLDGREEDRVVWIGEDGPETVVELSSPAGIREIEIDPDRDWLLELDLARLDQRAEFVNAFPNPFNPTVNLEYFVGEPMRVRLDVYDLRGRLVRRLLDAEVGPGIRSEQWEGDDEDGSTVASGTYLVVLTADGGIEERRTITLIK